MQNSPKGLQTILTLKLAIAKAVINSSKYDMQNEIEMSMDMIYYYTIFVLAHVLMQNGPMHQDHHVLIIYHHKLWLILFCFLVCSISLLWFWSAFSSLALKVVV